MPEDLAQPHPLRHRFGATAGEELEVQIGLGQAEVFQAEHLRAWTLQQIQGVHLGHQVTPVRPDLDQSGHRGLLGVVLPLLRCGTRGHSGLARARYDGRADGAMGSVFGTRGCQGLKVRAPGLRDTCRVTQELVVQRVNIVGVSAVRGCGFEHAKKSGRSKRSNRRLV